jgi:hypothetical protein
MEDGRPLDPAYVTRLFQKLRKQSEPLPELTFHGLRHTAASLMVAGGADISRVSNLLGHASISITADVYAHLVAAVGQKAVHGVRKSDPPYCSSRGFVELSRDVINALGFLLTQLYSVVMIRGRSVLTVTAAGTWYMTFPVTV